MQMQIIIVIEGTAETAVAAASAESSFSPGQPSNREPPPPSQILEQAAKREGSRLACLYLWKQFINKTNLWIPFFKYIQIFSKKNIIY
jgi:hypothetical protein